MKLNKLQIIIIITYFCMTNVSFSQIGIVVNKNNPITDISLSELKQIYSGKKTSFSNGETITLLEYKDLKEQFYDGLFSWSLMKVKKHWMRLIFSGESSVAPIVHENPNRIIEQIIRTESAIAFIKLSDANGDVKIISVDGKNPSDKAYQFRKKGN